MTAVATGAGAGPLGALASGAALAIGAVGAKVVVAVGLVVSGFAMSL